METKTLNYVRGGESFAITLRPFVPDFYDRSVAVRADDNNWFTPLVDSNSSLASHIRINDNGNTRALSTNPDIICNYYKETTATACTLITDQYDFGRLNPDGTQYFQNMASVKATQANSTIYGNSKANYFIPMGGDENFFAGGAGYTSDNYRMHNSSAVIVDFGIDIVTKRPDGTELAMSVSDEGYSRFDTGSYKKSVHQLSIYGSVTGIFFDNSPLSTSKYICVVDVAVTYTDENGNAQVVLLPAVMKSPHSTGSSPTFDSNYNDLMGIKIFEYAADGTLTTLNSTAKKALAHDWADFPAELRQKLLRLYDIYDQSDFYCSAVDEESVHQTVPDDLRYPTRDDNPIDMLDGRTLQGIKNIFNKGLGSKYFRVGDYFDITFAKSVTLQSSGVINAGSTWRVVLLGIDHNPELEGYNRGHFAIGRNTDNVEIAFATRRMNATATNAGGWGACEMRTWLNSTFYDALPSELKAVISPSTKYTDNVGGDCDVADNVTATVDNLWFLAVFETGTNSANTNSAEKNFQQKYEYYANGASLERHSTVSGNAVTSWRLRSPGKGGYQFKTAGGTRYNAATALSFVPCFTIGGESD